MAGIVLGPALIGRLPFASRLMEATKHQVNILNFVYWLGLLLLMFLSGAETRQLFTREERREVGWLAIMGTGIPFILGLVLGPWLIGPALAGPRRQSHFSDHHSRRRGRRNVGSGCFEDFRRLEDTPHPLRTTGSRRRRAGRHRAVAGAGGSDSNGRQNRAQLAGYVGSLDQHDRILRTGVDDPSPDGEAHK